MAVYLRNYVQMRDGIANQEGLTQLRRTVESYGGRWLSRDEEHRLDCVRENASVLVEFATFREAENWYNSSDYMNISHVYFDNAIALALVDGVSPDFTTAGFAE